MKAKVVGGSFRRLSRSWYLGCCLLDAMKYGRWEDVLALTKISDLDPNVIVPEYGIAPMHCAAGIEPEEFGFRCVQELLRIGGDPNVSCSEGVTPVHVASCWGRPRVLKCLLKRGGDPYLIDHEGKDAFYYATDKESVTKLLVADDNKKHKLLHAEDDKSMSPTRPKRVDVNVETSKDDLHLNSRAFSLMVKHRKSVHIFESIPEDDSASSTMTLEDTTEDFAYEPSEENNSSKKLRNKNRCIKDKPTGIETWVTSADDEINTENILEADKTRVIKVINENIIKCLSGSSISNGKSGTDWSEKGSCMTDQAWTDSHSKDVESTKSETIRGELALPKPCDDMEMGASSINVLKMTTGSINGTETSNTEAKCSSRRRMKSKSSCLIVKSESEESTYRTPLESKEIDHVSRTISLESSLSSRCRAKLPKITREKLLGFKTNTHYRSKTRIFRMVSKSCEGLKVKKSLYCTGFEFWSSKIKSRSNPSSVKRMSRNNVRP